MLEECIRSRLAAPCTSSHSWHGMAWQALRWASRTMPVQTTAKTCLSRKVCFIFLPWANVHRKAKAKQTQSNQYLLDQVVLTIWQYLVGSQCCCTACAFIPLAKGNCITSSGQNTSFNLQRPCNYGALTSTGNNMMHIVASQQIR